MNAHVENTATDAAINPNAQPNTALNGGHILAAADASSILASQSKPPSLTDGFEIVGQDLWKGVKTEVTQHLGRIGRDFATGSVVGIGADLAITGLAAVAGTTAAEVVGIGALTAGVAYGGYKLYQAGAELLNDAKTVSSPAAMAESRQAANQNAKDIGAGALDTTAGIVGGGLGMASGIGRALAIRLGNAVVSTSAAAGSDTSTVATTGPGGAIPEAADNGAISRAISAPAPGEGNATAGGDQVPASAGQLDRSGTTGAPQSTATADDPRDWPESKLTSVAAGNGDLSKQDNITLFNALNDRTLSPEQLGQVTKAILSKPQLSGGDLGKLSVVAESSSQATAESIYAATTDPGVLEGFVENGNLSKEFMQKVLNSLPEKSAMGNFSTKEWLATAPYLSTQSAELLATDSNAAVRAALAGNDEVPANIVNGQLISDPDASVRAAAAGNRNLTEASIARLSHDDNESVLAALAGNLSAPKALLEQLSKNAAAPVREGVAGNINAPKAVLDQLGQDPDQVVRSAVATNPAAPRDLRQQIFDQGVTVQVNQTLWVNDPRFEIMKEAGQSTYHGLAQYERDLVARWLTRPR